MDFQDFVNLKFDQGLSPTSIVKFHSIMHKCLKYAVALQIIPTNPSDNVMLPKRTRFRGQVYDRTQINIFLAAALQSPAEAAFVSPFSIFNSQFAESPPQTVPEHLLYLKENHSTETILHAGYQIISHKPNRAAAAPDTLRSISSTVA